MSEPEYSKSANEEKVTLSLDHAIQEVSLLLAEWFESANAHDTARHMALYLRDPSLIFVFDGTIVRGWNDLHQLQSSWWNDGQSDVVYTNTGESIFNPVSTRTVVSTSTIQTSATMKNGMLKNISVVATPVWRKLNTGWAIVYSHESTKRIDAGST